MLQSDVKVSDKEGAKQQLSDRYHMAWKIFPAIRTLLQWQFFLVRIGARLKCFGAQSRFDPARAAALTKRKEAVEARAPLDPQWTRVLAGADLLVDNLTRMLLRLFSDTRSWAIVSFLGMGTPRFSPRFRVAAKCVATLLLACQRGSDAPASAAAAAKDKKPPVLLPTTPLAFDWDGTRPCDEPLRVALVADFAALALNKPLAKHKELVNSLA